MTSLIQSFRSYAIKFPTTYFGPISVEQLDLKKLIDGDPDWSGGLDFSILWRHKTGWVLNEHGIYLDHYLRDYWNEL